MSRRSDEPRFEWTQAAIDDMMEMYNRKGVASLSHADIASALSRKYNFHITRNAVLGKVHRILGKGFKPREKQHDRNKANEVRKRAPRPSRGAVDRNIELALDAKKKPPVEVRPHVVDPATQTSMDDAMDRGLCLWPVSDTHVCGGERHDNGSRLRPTHYCLTHYRTTHVAPRQHMPTEGIDYSRRRRRLA